MKKMYFIIYISVTIFLVLPGIRSLWQAPIVQSPKFYRFAVSAWDENNQPQVKININTEKNKEEPPSGLLQLHTCISFLYIRLQLLKPNST